MESEQKKWISEEFEGCDLGDKRLDQRLMILLNRMWQSPNPSISAACKGFAEVMAASRFFQNEKVSQSKILAPHQEATLLRVSQHQQVLCVQDTTELDFTSRKKLKGSGPLSNVERRGFFAHNELVVTNQGVPLGLWHTSIWARDDQEHGKAEERKQRPFEEKESFRWLEGYRRACKLSELAPETQVISCSDRECDIYEVIAERQNLLKEGKPAAHWLIRAKHDRCLEQDQSDGNKLKISQQLEQSPVLGRICYSIAAKGQNKKIKGGSRKKTIRSKRTVVQDIRAIKVTLEPPYRAGHKLDPVTIFVIQAVEVNPPAGEEPINWTLLTSLECCTEEQARQVLELYRCRWQIEVFHRVLKTGCNVERLQLEGAQSIKLAVLLYMIVAWRVLYVMHLGRECPDLPCSVIFEAAEWHPTWVILKKGPLPEKPPSLNEMVRMIASFGGFLGRKSDGHPGAESVWRGMSRVLDFSLCWQLWGSGYLQSTA
jgi:hypothetical protein